MLRRFFFLSPLVIIAMLVPAAAHTQRATYGTVYQFCSQTGCPDGAVPESTMMQASDGNFYGATVYGGLGTGCFSDTGVPCGVIFKVSPAGQESVLYNFCDTTCGAAGLPADFIESGAGLLYGVSSLGFAGVTTTPDVFTLTPSGQVNSFDLPCSSEESCAGAYASLTQGSDGNFYGTTYGGGITNSACSGGCGTIFRMTPSGAFTTIYEFCADGGTLCSDGSLPNSKLLQAADGNFYGTTSEGGVGNASCETFGCGTIFKLTPSGALTTLYSFCTVANCPDGWFPGGNLVEDSAGNLYGLTDVPTIYNGSGCEYSAGTTYCGTLFRLTPSGTFSTLYTFCSETACADGSTPGPQLLAGSDGNLYGATVSGGAGYGTAFRVTPAGVFSPLYAFTSDNGSQPYGMIQGADGQFYGDLISTDGSRVGAIFKLSLASALPAPVQVSLSATALPLGSPLTISWKALNAYSLTSQQCYAYPRATVGSATGAGNWTGLQTGALVDGVYQGSVTLTPTAAGVYSYALTCGGINSGFSGSINIGNAKSATTLALTTNSPVTLGTAAKLTATLATTQNVGAYAGTVAFSYGSLALGTATPSNGAASLTLTAQGIPDGTYPITASYSGNANYSSSSATSNVVILGYATATTVAPSTTKLTQGQSITLSSSVARTDATGTPTGSVTFYAAGSTPLGTVTLKNGSASLTAGTNSSIPPGNYEITAEYNGDAYDQTSLSAATTVTLQAE